MYLFMYFYVIHLCLCMCMYLYISLWVCVCVCVHICMCLYVCVFAHMYTRVRALMLLSDNNQARRLDSIFIMSTIIPTQMPLFLDLLGTCHTETMKPAVLQSKHLKWYKTHVDRGLSYTAPEQLNQQLRDGLLKVDHTGALYKPEVSIVDYHDVVS